MKDNYNGNNPKDIRFSSSDDDNEKRGMPKDFKLSNDTVDNNIFSDDVDVKLDIGNFKPRKVQSALSGESDTLGDFSAHYNEPKSNETKFAELKLNEPELEKDSFKKKLELPKKEIRYSPEPEENPTQNSKKPLDSMFTLGHNPKSANQNEATTEEKESEDVNGFFSRTKKVSEPTKVKSDQVLPPEFKQEPPNQLLRQGKPGFTMDSVLQNDVQAFVQEQRNNTETVRENELQNSVKTTLEQIPNRENGNLPNKKLTKQQAKRQNKIAPPIASKREFVDKSNEQSTDVDALQESQVSLSSASMRPISQQPLGLSNQKTINSTKRITSDELTDKKEIDSGKTQQIPDISDSSQSPKKSQPQFKTAVVPTVPQQETTRSKPKFVINPVPIPPEVIEDRLPNRHPKKRRRKKRTSVLGMIARILIALMLLSALTVGTMGIVYAAGDLLGLKESEEVIQVTIDPDTPVSQVAQVLKDNGIINYTEVFKLYIKYHLKNDVAFKYGTFTLHPSMAYEEIITTLEQAAASDTKFRFTIREGQNISAIADELQADGICQRDEFLEAVRTHPFENEYVAQITNPDQRYYKLEGYLFPNTYEFVQNTPPDEIINTLLNEFNNQIDGNNVDNLSENLDRVITVASIVQAEAPTKQEMMKVASIYWNRINNPGMFSMLQSDPTSKYAERTLVPNGAPQALADAYDTYKTQGIPPGPINNPGMQAIMATLYPATTNYYYFCTDATGAFYYATTYEEHQNNLALAGIDENNLD